MKKEKKPEVKETRTVYQLFADWLAKDAQNAGIKYNVQWSDEGFLVNRQVPETNSQK